MKLEEKIFQELKEKKLSIEELDDRYFIPFQRSNEVEVENILKLLNENICSFKEIVDKFKNIKNVWRNPCLYRLLENKELFKELIENNRLSKDDLEHLLNRINKWYELYPLNSNTSLIKKILNEFVFNKEDVDKFNEIIETADGFLSDWFKEHNIHTIFECIWHYYHKNDKEILKLNELNKYVYRLDKDEKSEIVEILKDNEQIQNRLIQIVENNLEDTYDFETLKNLLTKDGKKALKTKFNL